jgi:peptidoglycan-N-acetylglucosamine deacetylase
MLAAVLPRRRFVTHGPTAGDEVALTFDDGPHPDLTPRLLDLLATLQLPATFFVIGQRAERHPALIQRMVAEGHTVGHHSWTHSEPSRTSAATLLAEVHRSQLLLASLGVTACNRFRPPRGELTTAKLTWLLAAGQRVVLWSNDPRDYAMTDPTALVNWARRAAIGAGDIVLLHDVHPHCLTALEPLAAQVRAGGRRFVPLDAWLPAA